METTVQTAGVSRGRVRKSKLFYDLYHLIDMKYNYGFIEPPVGHNMWFRNYSDVGERLKYSPEIHFKNVQNLNHNGQRKLLTTELQFLMNHLYLFNEFNVQDSEQSTEHLVVYIGASPGSHLITILDFFPKIVMHLYDERYICPGVVKYVKEGRVKIFQELFTPEKADSYRNIPHLLISDIRSLLTTRLEASDESDLYPSGYDKYMKTILNDLNIQKEIVLRSNPLAVSLKFKLPYKRGVTQYFDGTISLQNWTKRDSAETRLIALRPYSIKEYNHTEYEEKMYFYNQKIRKSYIGNPYIEYINKLRERITINAFLPFKFHNKFYKSNEVIRKQMLLRNRYTIPSPFYGLCCCYDCFADICLCNIFYHWYNFVNEHNRYPVPAEIEEFRFNPDDYETYIPIMDFGRIYMNITIGSINGVIRIIENVRKIYPDYEFRWSSTF